MLTGCGDGVPEQRVEIVDPDTGAPCPPGRVGEIWVAGPSVAQGYWGRPAQAAGTFGARLADGSGPFLRTGDLGFRRDGHLVVTGRIKDLMIVRGRNHYPQDLEFAAERADPALRPGCSAAFLADPDAGDEDLVRAARIAGRFSQGRDADRIEVEIVRRNGVARQLAVVPMRSDEVPEAWYL